jgi:hypothetical protein
VTTKRDDEYADMNDPMFERDDVYEHMSVRDIEMNDRLDYAREVEQNGDPERASEIRMGA